MKLEPEEGVTPCTKFTLLHVADLHLVLAWGQTPVVAENKVMWAIYGSKDLAKLKNIALLKGKIVEILGFFCIILGWPHLIFIEL